MGSAGYPKLAELFMRELGVVISELSAATWTDVIGLGRIGKAVVETNWAAILHKSTLAHS